MPRVVAIDVGQKRCGIAVSDPQQLIAGALTVVPTADLYAFLVDYLAREEVERLVVGLPLQDDGTPSDNYPRVQAFVAQWRKRQTTPIEYYDERYTSRLAQLTIRAAGARRKQRQEKGLVDTVSATILLQDWMHRNNR